MTGKAADDPGDADRPFELSKTLFDVQGAQAGDAACWETLDRRCRKWIHAKLRRKGMPPQIDPDDVAQLVLQDVFVGFHRFEVKPGAMFWAWLNQITENRVIDLKRWHMAQKRKGEVRFRDYYESSVIEPDVPAREASLSAVVRYNEAEQHYREAIGRLPDQQRDILQLRELEGLTYKEIGARLELDNIDSIRVMCHRARERVREMMRTFADTRMWPEPDTDDKPSDA